MVNAVDVIVVAVPSAYVSSIFEGIDAGLLEGKKIVSAVKGILPDHNVLLNQYLHTKYYFPLNHYFTLLGPCHAEEVAAEVQAIVAELGAKGPGDMGKVMGAVKTRLAGKADMGEVSAAVKAALAG